jgi:hypothetical protein
MYLKLLFIVLLVFIKFEGYYFRSLIRPLFEYIPEPLLFILLLIPVVVWAIVLLILFMF